MKKNVKKILLVASSLFVFGVVMTHRMQSTEDILLREEYQVHYEAANLFDTIPEEDRILLEEMGMDFALMCNPGERTYTCSDRCYVYDIDLIEDTMNKWLDDNDQPVTINDLFDQIVN